MAKEPFWFRRSLSSWYESPMSLPVLYEADPVDLRNAIRRIRERISNLQQPRLYGIAVALTVLARQGRVTTWPSWDSPPPMSAEPIGRRNLVWAMWQLFGACPDALISIGSAVCVQLHDPSRVLLDVFYDPGGPLTLVAPNPIPGQNRRDAVKLTLENPSWIWSDKTNGSNALADIIEYNPVNSINQQNGIGCALPTAVAVAEHPDSTDSVYAILRAQCPQRITPDDSEPKCSLNGKVCGGQGDGAERHATKPRLLAPPVNDSHGHLLLPGSIRTLVALATAGGRSLPAASDLSLLVSWCYTGGSGVQDATRLVNLLGADGIRLLTSST